MDWSIDDVSRFISESLDDKDEFVGEGGEHWHRTFQSLFDEGGAGAISSAIETHFVPLRVEEINTDKNYVVLTGYDGDSALGPRVPQNQKRVLASRKFVVGFDWNQQLADWMRSRLIIKLNSIDHLFNKYTIYNHPLLFETLDDRDVFRNNDWEITFQELLDEGGPESVKQTIETGFPGLKVIDVFDDVITLFAPTKNDRLGKKERRRITVPYTPTQSLIHWIAKDYMKVMNQVDHEKEPLTKERHPLFFEDVGPWGDERTNKPWGWQALVIPAGEGQVRQSGEGLDDTDEFMTGDEPWSVTVTNKNIPGKELKGVVGWERGEITGHFPRVFSLERNDFSMSEDFAKKVIWAAYWAAEETTEGRTSHEAFELDTYLVGIGRDGEELLKYINDPEHYGKQYPSKQSGWTSVGTHTYEESANPFTVTLGSRPFTKLHEVDLMNIQMGAWHWPKPELSPSISNFLYSDAETIADHYPEMFVWWAPILDLREFYDQQDEELPPHEGPDLDDRDEFEDDDPEIDLQKWDDAEQIGASAARDRMFKEAATLEPEMRTLGLELLYVGAAPGLNRKRELRPFIIVGRKKPMAENIDDRDQFTTYKIRVICGWCKKPLGEKPTSDPKQDGKISHGMCRDCEIEQYKQLGMEPPIREGLDDKDEFQHKYCSCSAGEMGGEHLPWCDYAVLDDVDDFEPADYCDRCNEPFRREELTRVNPHEPAWSVDRVCAQCLEIINQGPQDDRWLERFNESVGLDDKDDFVDGLRCERCNSTDWVEPAYFNNTVENLCRWCKKALFTESLEDADEFGYVKATAGYEESGIDDSKHVFNFEDGARLYQDAKVVNNGTYDTDVQYRVALKLPDGSVHRSDTLKYNDQDLPPPFNVYMDGVYAFIRDGDILPFTPVLFKEFNSIMHPNVIESIADTLDEAFRPEPSLATILNARGVRPDPCEFKPQIGDQPEGFLDDTDEFENRRGACAGYGGNIRLIDQEGDDVTDQLSRGFREMMSVWVDHSPNWKAHHDWGGDFPGSLSTRPPLLGPECVVWADAPTGNQPVGPTYGHGQTALPRTQTKAAWYHPGEGKWIDE